MGKRTIIYQPPNAEALEDLAYEACHRLGETFDEREVAAGLAAFLKVIARALVHHLNGQRSAFDRGIE